MKKKKQQFQLDVKTELHDVESSAAECLVPDQGVTDAILAEIDEAISKNKKISKKRISKWPKLPLEFKNKWVAALRSGEYKKTKDALVSDNGNYCVLGVAAAISGYSNEAIMFSSVHGEDNAFIPFKFGNVPQILREDGDLPEKLADMNDRYYSFNKLADWIEKNL